MTDLDGMAQCPAVDFLGQELEKAFEIVRVEFFRGHELPVDRTELVAEMRESLLDEAGDRFRR